MKRQAGGPGGDPADATNEMGRWDADGWDAHGSGADAPPGAGSTDYSGAGHSAAGPTSYASADPEAGGVELLEDRTVRIQGGGHGRRFGVSVPGAIVGSFVVAALALGAALGPLAADPTSDTGNHGNTANTEPTKKPAGDGYGPGKTAKPAGEPTKTAKPGNEPDKTEAPKATDKPAPTEAPAPDAAGLQIALALDGASVVVEWSACETDDFAYYKVIRSKDEFATWPLGAGDSLAAAIEDRGVTRFVDKTAAGGRTWFYKVVALRGWDGEKVVACRSDVKSIATPAPTPKPEPTDDGKVDMGLTVTIKEGHPFLDWTACEGVDFDYYKVVRSTDSTVTWPKGDNDSMVTAVGAHDETKAWDGDAPGGKKVYYRVFCVRATDNGYVAVAASPVKAVETPETEPAPEPVGLGFEVDVTGEGVILDWAASTSDHFAFYKVVRSFTNDNPSYLPGTEGSQVIGVIESSGNTELLDSDVESGQTVYYRVQAIGYWYGQKILLGQTAVIAVTIP
jgi:hypothetical protein